jgi:hypothetical protein
MDRASRRDFKGSDAGTTVGPDAGQSADLMIGTPNEYDVLLGRGRGHQQHVGNRRYQGKQFGFPDFKYVP